MKTPMQPTTTVLAPRFGSAGAHVEGIRSVRVGSCSGMGKHRLATGKAPPIRCFARHTGTAAGRQIGNGRVD